MAAGTKSIGRSPKSSDRQPKSSGRQPRRLLPVGASTGARLSPVGASPKSSGHSPESSALVRWESAPPPCETLT